MVARELGIFFLQVQTAHLVAKRLVAVVVAMEPVGESLGGVLLLLGRENLVGLELHLGVGENLFKYVLDCGVLEGEVSV